MIMKINRNDMLNVVEKMNGWYKDGIHLIITGKGSSDHRLAQIMGSDGATCQALCSFMVETDVDHSSLSLDAKLFFSAAKALSKMGSQLTLSLDDKEPILSCGPSKTAMRVVDAPVFLMEPKKEDYVLKITLATESFRQMIDSIGYASAIGMDSEALIAFLVNESITAISADQILCGMSEVSYLERHCTFKEAPNQFLVGARKIIDLLPKLEGEITNLFFYSNKLFINSGNDLFYIILSSRIPFSPASLQEKLLKQIEAAEYSFTINTKLIKHMVEIAALGNNDACKHAMLHLKIDGNITISSISEKNGTVMAVEKHEGEVKTWFNIACVKSMLDHAKNEEVKISGCGSTGLILIKTSEHSYGAVAPFNPEPSF